MGLFRKKKDKRGNYLIVCHMWWMEHRGWYKELLCDVTEAEAKAQAALVAQERDSQFRHATATYYQIPDHIAVVEKQKVEDKGDWRS